jgi:hypothetical protein
VTVFKEGAVLKRELEYVSFQLAILSEKNETLTNKMNEATSAAKELEEKVASLEGQVTLLGSYPLQLQQQLTEQNHAFDTFKDQITKLLAVPESPSPVAEREVHTLPGLIVILKLDIYNDISKSINRLPEPLTPAGSPGIPFFFKCLSEISNEQFQPRTSTIVHNRQMHHQSQSTLLKCVHCYEEMNELYHSSTCNDNTCSKIVDKRWIVKSVKSEAELEDLPGHEFICRKCKDATKEAREKYTSDNRKRQKMVVLMNLIFRTSKRSDSSLILFFFLLITLI